MKSDLAASSSPADAREKPPSAERSLPMGMTSDPRQGPLAPADDPEGPRSLAHGKNASRPRRPLGLAVRLLEEGRNAIGFPGLVQRPARPPAIAEGARFEQRSFACPEGRRDYKLYVPSQAEEGLRGLIVMLHGCRQDADDFAVGTAMNQQAERERLLVAYPCQGAADNLLGCWHWFNPADQRRDCGEPAIIAGIARSLFVEFPVENRRAMAAGLSAGGSMAAVLGATYPDLFGTIGVHSGLPYGAAHDVASALAAMRGEWADGPVGVLSCRTIVFHGDADTVVHPGNAGRILAAAGPADVQRATGASPGGRPYRVERLTDPRGACRFELWMVEGAGHAWAGGDPAGSFTDPDGPDASAEMVRFFLQQS